MNTTNNKFKIKDLGSILKDTFKDWNNDDAFTHAAAVSYYAIFSLPAIVIILINVAGVIFGKEAIQGELSGNIEKMIGQDFAGQIQTMIQNANVQSNSTVMFVIGIGVLMVSATTLFMQMQKALNRMWEVKTREDVGMLKVIFDRTKTFGIIISMGFLLLISMVVTGLISAFSEWLTRMLPDVAVYIIHIVNFIFSLGIITCIFALIFKILPDVRIQFRTVWVGAFVTAVLFMVAQYGLSLYFSMAKPESAYGVAGSFILLLLWVYYSCLLLFFGAEFTQVYALKYGHKIEPKKSAIKIEPCIPTEPHSYSTR